MAFTLFEIMRFIHLVAVIMWAGGAAFHLMVLAPAVQAAGAAGAGLMRAVLGRGGFGKYYGPASVLAVISGAYLFHADRLDKSGVATATASNTLLTLGAVAGFAAFVLSLALSMPVESKMKALVRDIPSEQPLTPEQGKQLRELAEKAMGHARITAGLVFTAMIAMAGRGLLV